MPGLVHVYALPTSPVIFQHADTLLIATTAAHYQWYYESVAISNSDNQFYLAVLPGNYSVEITDSSGCQASSQLYYFSLVGINDIGEAGKISIYPNPVTDFLNIRISSAEKYEVKIKIETILGTTLVEKSINAGNGITFFSVDVSNLASGIYFISLETSKGILVEKFTRQ